MRVLLRTRQSILSPAGTLGTQAQVSSNKLIGKYPCKGRKRQKKPRVVDLRWSVGDSLRPVPVKKGWGGGGAENVQKA